MNPLSAFVAIGSNVGDSIRIVRAAMNQLEELSAEPLLRSSLWETEPVDCPPGSNPFINAVVRLAPKPGATPEEWLRTLKEWEAGWGRTTKSIRNEPRTIDLDLIAFGSERRNSAELILPHPRAHQRRFVLLPLSELTPDLCLPGQSVSVRELLDRAPPLSMRRIDS